ncbi:uncharacterized protein LOC119983129 [Tripterygium wilfordii]|uniref:uncharacterized protein LOC119983129 n=1 Tax=Tripterygium wilfordii TaxID=458696 RepID=UPI0018F80EF6|nr:uncharacterized protein LOC119983129 [Tripterygium wilfordii]
MRSVILLLSGTSTSFLQTTCVYYVNLDCLLVAGGVFVEIGNRSTSFQLTTCVYYIDLGCSLAIGGVFVSDSLLNFSHRKEMVSLDEVDSRINLYQIDGVNDCVENGAKTDGLIAPIVGMLF